MRIKCLEVTRGERCCSSETPRTWRWVGDRGVEQGEYGSSDDNDDEWERGSGDGKVVSTSSTSTSAATARAKFDKSLAVVALMLPSRSPSWPRGVERIDQIRTLLQPETTGCTCTFATLVQFFTHLHITSLQSVSPGLVGAIKRRYKMPSTHTHTPDMETKESK